MSIPGSFWIPWWVLVGTFNGQPSVVYAKFPTEKACWGASNALTRIGGSHNFLHGCITENEARARWPGLFVEEEQGPFQPGPARVLMPESLRPGAGARPPDKKAPHPQGDPPSAKANNPTKEGTR